MRKTALIAAALACPAAAFVQTPGVSQAPAQQQGAFLRQLGERVDMSSTAEEAPEAGSWASSVLGMSAALGLLAAVAVPGAARAITSEQFEQLTYEQVKGSG
eukprot:CAMPEP_0178401534 /NCGR_PEP_ID=MMETSP0689_2-20121128/16353_1 /TAXON_ID=160604 /ORGANISM="Amphidinium massartii, Strain CS-259" /LENGTH=101 /DNA_ID=CAMNT_0020022361 /DNA_START=74 /DNA_END=376 /DNA_ORIENTATION=+